MRVVLLVTNYPAEGLLVRGNFHRTLAEAVARAGAEVEVLAPVPQVPWFLRRLNGRWAGYARMPERYDLGGVSVSRPRYWQVPRGTSLGFGHRPLARCLKASLRQGRDVVHAHFAYPCGTAAGIVAARSGVPVVLTLHGSDVNISPNTSGRLKGFFHRAVEQATVVTAVSRSLAKRTEEMTGRLPIVMPIGIDLRRYRDLPSKAEARRQVGLPDDAAVALFVGGLWEGKGVLLLVDAIGKIGRPDLRGLFVGDGPLRPTISSRPGILSVGAVPPERVPLYLRAADMMVLPSFSEGMPTVIVEAGAAGLPVVASEVGGVGEILGDGRGLLVPPGNGARLVEAMESVLDDSSAAAERAARLKEYVGLHYDADRNARSMLEIYEGLR